MSNKKVYKLGSLKDMIDAVDANNFVALTDAINKYMAFCVAAKEQNMHAQIPTEIMWEDDGTKDFTLTTLDGKIILKVKFDDVNSNKKSKRYH